MEIGATTNEQLAQAINTLTGQLKSTAHKAVSSTPTATYGHGQQVPGGTSGLFSYPGLERPIVNAMIMPTFGLIDMLPSRTSIYDRTLYGIMTGVTASSGSEPTGVCDDPPVSGLMKLCTHNFLWGRFSRMTKVYDIDRFGRYRDRSDFNDLELIGDPFAAGTAPIPQTPGSASPGLAMRSEIAKAMFEFSVSWARDFAPLIWTGNPTNNTAGDGYKEPYGLDILVNDGYRDAESGTACPAADSIVLDFASAEVNTNGASFIRQATSVVRRLRDNARRMRLTPLTLAAVMRPELFYEITEVWACAFFTYRCNTDFSATQQQVIDANETIRLRDAMRAGQYLWIDGTAFPVILDDTIPETALAGSSYRSTIYFLPIRYAGNRPGIFLEYINYDGPMGAIEAASVFAPNSYYTTNGGRYLWHAKPPTNFCVQLLAKTEWRLILEVPQLAGRMDNVKYTPVAHFRDWDPDSSFYVDGGRTSRTDLSYYSPTS